MRLAHSFATSSNYENANGRFAPGAALRALAKSNIGVAAQSQKQRRLFSTRTKLYLAIEEHFTGGGASPAHHNPISDGIWLRCDNSAIAQVSNDIGKGSATVD